MDHQNLFNHEDLKEIHGHGLSVEEVIRQVGIFERSAPHLNLIRPCTKGDGITVVDPESVPLLTQSFEKNLPRHRCVKFVPASGAASRMFKTLLGEFNKGGDILRETISKKAQAGDPDHQELLKFLDGLHRFAFFQDLKLEMSKKGLQIRDLIEEGRFRDVINYLLHESGLNYANLPKGLLKFHQYGDGNRTAFEEHLVEAVQYTADREGVCRLHFTVSPEHMEKFKFVFEEIKPIFEKKYQVSLQVDFSLQKKSTDTIAVDLFNKPFRDEKGRLLFRPGGHGALIENINELDADIIFLKNIDNVVPDRLKGETIQWKKILGGYLLTLQGHVHGFIKALSETVPDVSFLTRTATFIRDELNMEVPEAFEKASSQEKTTVLLERLNRPIRVCGMVKNEGEPGGGPFWVRDSNGEVSLQIVEKDQIDTESTNQRTILREATHFNPVDLVCAVRDWRGRPLDLRQYVDKHAVFISKKSKNGKDLKALEHPGLWNGAMSKWITVFVEVPITTFNPVKSVNDLLRKEHQPG